MHIGYMQRNSSQPRLNGCFSAKRFGLMAGGGVSGGAECAGDSWRHRPDAFRHFQRACLHCAALRRVILACSASIRMVICHHRCAIPFTSRTDGSWPDAACHCALLYLVAWAFILCSWYSDWGTWALVVVGCCSSKTFGIKGGCRQRIIVAVCA